MLYLVATPIGNLKDLSFRQAEVLSKADVILSEDTRSFLRIKKAIEELFQFKFKKEQKLISYYKEKELEKIPLILDLLRQGKDIALVSEAGMPLISDPGSLLLKTIVQEGFEFTVVPGPSAFVTAAVFSGFSFSEIVFLGYFPKKKQARFLEKLKKTTESLEDPVFVLYESPHRIKKTCEKLFDYFDAKLKICLCREMTKKFEERLVLEKKEQISLIREQGEYTLVLKIS